MWYDHAGYSGTRSSWETLELRKVDTEPTSLTNDEKSPKFRCTFTGVLPNPFTDPSKTYKGRYIRFTLRYRANSDQPWQWVKDQFGTADGELLVQPPVDPNWVSASPVELVAGWSTRKVPSECPDARLYYIESTQPIPDFDLKHTDYEEKVLGKVTLCCRFFALTRIWSPWLGPKHGKNLFNVTEDAIVCSFLRTDGRHVVILAINGIDDIITVFKSTPAGDIVVASRNDTGKDGKFRLLAASAWTFDIAMASVVYEMRKMVRLGSTSTAPSRRPSQPPEPSRKLSGSSHIRSDPIDSDPDTILVSRARELSIAASSSEEPTPTPQFLEEWYDKLAFCTWNSLGQSLTPEKIFNALDSLASDNVKVATVIIDDNWQSLDSGSSQFGRGMTKFEANDAFPGGLKALTTQIRQKFPWIKDIAVWHALCGYWGGISPHGNIAKQYRVTSVRKSAISRMGSESMTVVHADDISRFYSDFYEFLSSSGVTSVKTDAQFMLDLFADTSDRHNTITKYQSAWTRAHLTHFSGKAISCMSQIPQILYHSFLPTDKPQILLRNSDDFFPNVESSHTWHIFCNAHNALFVQHLNVLPDWDMFQTVHDYSGFHAASRCLSGGPIYITDEPGKHDKHLIRQIAARGVRDGESIILRPSTIAKAQFMYDSYEEGHVLKIGTWDGKADVGTGMLGLFNIAKEEKSFMIPITDIPGVDVYEQDTDGVNGHITHDHSQPLKWIIRSFQSGRMAGPILPTLPLTPDQLLKGRLGIRGYHILSARPVHQISLASQNQLEVAVLGLIDKMTGGVAILESQFSAVDGGKRARVTVHLKALGNLGVWVGQEVQRGDMMVLLKGKPVPESRVKIENVDGVDAGPVMVSIDLEAAWDEMKLDPGWNNELWVEVFIR